MAWEGLKPSIRLPRHSGSPLPCFWIRRTVMNKTPISKLAQVKVKAAVDSGKLIKPDRCQKCGKSPKHLHAHHENYEKPLEVIWLCPLCHKIEHPACQNHHKDNDLSKYQPPPMTIPSDYAETAGCDRTTIYHINAGRKRFRIDQACKVLDRAQGDPRLTGLNIIHLRPELTQAFPHLCKLCPKKQKKETKKGAGRGR